MKYTFHDNVKQRANGYPFSVLFTCEEYDGWLSVVSHSAGSGPKFNVGFPHDMSSEDFEDLSRELEMHLTGEAYCD